jgi:hypothetical protein
METGRTVKQDDTQYLIGKSRGPYVAETINEYFLSLANNLTNLAASSLGNSADRDFLSFMEQAIKSKFPKICNKSVTTREIEKIIYSFFHLLVPRGKYPASPT